MFRKIIHIVFAVLILGSTTGMTINLHYCQDTLYDIGLNKPAQSCCDTGSDKKHCHHGSILKKPHHCKDETIKVESTDAFLVSSYTFGLNKAQTIDLFLTAQILLENQSTTKKATNEVLDYKKPPTPQEVVLSQIQSFLI